MIVELYVVPFWSCIELVILKKYRTCSLASAIFLVTVLSAQSCKKLQSLSEHLVFFFTVCKPFRLNLRDLV